MKNKPHVVNIIGAGFAGIECALFLADHGINVHIFDCGNDYQCNCSYCEVSDGENEEQSLARDLLRAELHTLGSAIIEAEGKIKRETSGRCLARKLLTYGLERAKKHKKIEFFKLCVSDLNLEEVNVVATGPHTKGNLFEWLKNLYGSMRFHDNCCCYPILQGVDQKKVYTKDGDDKNLYIPLDYQQYIALCNKIIKERNSLLKNGKEIEKNPQTIEFMVAKDKDCLKNNIMRPVYLSSLDKKPYAVIKLVSVADGYMLDGFCSLLPPQAQYEIINSIEGLEKCVILQTGKFFENSYINAPFMINSFGQSTKIENIFFAGSVAGVSGHIESMAMGLYVGYNVLSYFCHRKMVPISPQTAIGSMMKKLTQNTIKFDPIEANYDIISMEKVYKTLKGKQDFLFKRSFSLIEKYKEECFNGKHV